MMVLCLFGMCVSFAVGNKRNRSKKAEDTRVYIKHADELTYDIFGPHPDAQIARGHVSFLHKGTTLTCDSAYFYEQKNAFEAFGHVFMKQGDTLTLRSDWAYYDGFADMAQARRNVKLTHNKSVLTTDSLNYDLFYGDVYFIEGGKLVDNGNTLTADWGKYNTETKNAVFYYDVRLNNKKSRLETDTLYYDTSTSLAHAVGKSKMYSDGNVVNTTDGYYNTKTDRSELYGRSTVINGDRTITADSMYTNNKTSENEGFGNVVYVDKKNNNSFFGEHVYYVENTGYGYATDKALAKEYSQGNDTLFIHGDTIKIFTFNINTDSVHREVHAYNHVRAYRTDIQAVCDSLTYTTIDSCMTMYKDPIVWNMGRQILGEVIHAYMNDSTVRYADVIGQALSVEQMSDTTKYNQISSHEMRAYFEEGKVRQTWSIGNVQSVYYPIDDGDSTVIGLNYLETDTMKMYITADRSLDKIWTSKAEGTLYPITQTPPEKHRLPNFAWFDYIRPRDKYDIFEWRPKSAATVLKKEKRREAPKRNIVNATSDTSPAIAKGEGKQ